MKLRIENYHLACFIFQVIKDFWWGVLRRKSQFDEVTGIDWEEKEIDKYYLLNFK